MMSSLADRQGHHESFLKNLLRSVNVLLAAAVVVVAGCGIPGVGGGSTPTLAGSYLYTDKYHSAMLALRLVQHHSQLTGTFESLLPVSSQQAAQDNVGITVLDQHGNPVPWPAANSTDPATGRSDNGACGGTSACLEELKAAITGQVGNRGRISIDLGWGVQFFGDQTLIAELHGRTLVFRINGTDTVFHPAGERSIQEVYGEVFTTLRTLLIPAANLDQEAQYLRGPTSLTDDVSGLQGVLDNVNQNPNGFLNPYVCEFQQSFTDQVNQTQQDINAEAKDVQRAQAELKPYEHQGSTLAAYGRSSGAVSELQAAITTAVAKINDTVKKANGVIAEANRDAPNIINVMNGAGCAASHSLDIGLHALHIYLKLAALAG